MNGEKPISESLVFVAMGTVEFRRAYSLLWTALSFLDWSYNPWKVQGLSRWSVLVERASMESGCLRSQPKLGGRPHLRLNITTRPIANKYREGKLQRTLKREFKRA